MGNGERARPGRIQPAPSPVGAEASIFTKWLASIMASEVAGEAPATAPGALPNLTNCIDGLARKCHMHGDAF